MLSDSQPLKIEAHYYGAIMLEAITAAVSSFGLLEQAKTENNPHAKLECDRSSGIYARYAFQTACIAAEAGANALLESAANMGKSLYNDLENLKTLNKYEVYALVNGTPLDRGSNIYSAMKSVISHRNKFFHPKRVQVSLADHGRLNSDIAKSTVSCSVPALDLLGPHNAIPMVADILKFIAWVVCDTCKHTEQEGAGLLSRGIGVTTGDLISANRDMGYDIRSFGLSC